MKQVIITLIAALIFAATANAIKFQLPEVNSQQIQEENAFIRAEGLSRAKSTICILKSFEKGWVKNAKR